MNLRRTGEAGVPIKIAVRKRKRSSAIFEERCGDAAGPARQAEVLSLVFSEANLRVALRRIANATTTTSSRIHLQSIVRRSYFIDAREGSGHRRVEESRESSPRDTPAA